MVPSSAWIGVKLIDEAVLSVAIDIAAHDMGLKPIGMPWGGIDRIADFAGPGLHFGDQRIRPAARAVLAAQPDRHPQSQFHAGRRGGCGPLWLRHSPRQGSFLLRSRWLPRYWFKFDGADLSDGFR